VSDSLYAGVTDLGGARNKKIGLPLSKEGASGKQACRCASRGESVSVLWKAEQQELERFCHIPGIAGDARASLGCACVSIGVSAGTSRARRLQSRKLQVKALPCARSKEFQRN